MVLIERLDQELRTAIPAIDGVALPAMAHETVSPSTHHMRTADGVLVRVNWSQPPTAQQVVDAEAVAQAHDGAAIEAEKAAAETNAATIRDVLLAEIDAVLTEADALQTILDQWELTPPNNAAVLAHVKRVTRDLIRMARDVVRLVRLALRKLDQS
jgi:hypothetical protein